jgi:ubiquinone/menaquinone biosynthesis C-methylase UbiE
MVHVGPENVLVRRRAEPEVMADPEQARAYASADFSVPHEQLVDHFRRLIGDAGDDAFVLDLGCGPADVSIRFARAFPSVRIHGIDASEPMLALGRQAVGWAGLSERIELYGGHLPEALLPRDGYEGVLSNSLLHHVVHPSVLWRTVRKAAAPGAWIFVMDLRRPENEDEARRLVDLHAAGEAEMMRRDFFNSLLAAYRPAEIDDQLRAEGLDALRIEPIGDRHVIVWGRFPA